MSQNKPNKSLFFLPRDWKEEKNKKYIIDTGNPALFINFTLDNHICVRNKNKICPKARKFIDGPDF